MNEGRNLSARLAPIALVTGLLLTAACSGSQRYPIGLATDEGMRHATYDLLVSYRPGSSELMSSDWRLDNFGPGEENFGVPKTTERYTRTIALDHDGDDRADARSRIPAYDLLFKHRRNDGVIFMSTLPVSQHAGQRDLDIILRDFVESASHAGHITHNFEVGSSRTSAQMASRILSTRAVTVDGYPAHEVIFEVANVQQLELTPEARWERGHVVLVRAPFAFTERQYATFAPQRAVPVPFYPVLLAIGYANHPDEFDEGHAAFEDLVRRVRIGRTQDLSSVRSSLTTCDENYRSVALLTRTNGRASLFADSGDTEFLTCVRNTLGRFRFSESEWPHTFVIDQVDPRSGAGETTAGGVAEPAAPAPPPSAPSAPTPAPAETSGTPADAEAAPSPDPSAAPAGTDATPAAP